MTTLHSGLAAHIQALLDVKHALGLPYVESGRHLQMFDAMCAKDSPGQATLARQMAMAWAAARPGEHVNGQMRRITPVRQLAKHMTAQGAKAYVIPAGIPGRQIHYRPHLYTPAELRAIFDAADQIHATPFGGRRELIIPVMFRMIYCLGLRPGEARRLRRADVDLTDGSVYIRESKGHKDRRVFASADLHQYLRSYDTAITAHHPDRPVFFPNPVGDAYSAGTIDYWFSQLLQAAGITAACEPRPRVYDLRHAHVIETINRCARAGRDPQVLVAYLSLHLGHGNTADTWYYFHLAADFHPDLRALANTGIEASLPEAGHGPR
ncbi:tyrosine-type recombinase/integrase [Leekyejoonella antrihumi]|uniref:Integrase n=1 Tax=Leekyejoonella antrihumi TaxID=1660198 RepID=A0A563DS19_9MICO|nr:tyrosine-type recombinase/integrase [Leekyejoonella antrihumi]TWP33040.1 integrase [Leekyejoonella antrihumi]